MICLGYTDTRKLDAVTAYCAQHAIRKVFVLSPERFSFDCARLTVEHEVIQWADIIQYTYYYRLLQEIDASTLLIVNECLRTQNRYDLTYNCMRLFLQQTPHQLIFQYLPLIDSWEDFAILFDFNTKSRWKRQIIDGDRLKETTVRVAPVCVEFEAVRVSADAHTRAAYALKREHLFAEVRNDPAKDPHNIPRNLYLLSGRAKLAHTMAGRFVGRNNRFKLPNLVTYRDVRRQEGESFTIFEFPHNFINFSDFLAMTGQAEFPVLVADLKVDQWYLERYNGWAERLKSAYKTFIDGGAIKC